MRISITLSLAAIVAFLCLTPAAALQQDPPPPDINLEFEAAKAIEKGIAALKGKNVHSKGTSKMHHFKNGNALVLLTYVHAGVDEKDPHFQKLLKEALKSELEATYGVCLIAMALEELDRVKYQWRIYQCAQFLVDNMSTGGTIRYGEKTKMPPMPESNDVATDANRKNTGTGGSILARNRPPAEGHEKPKPRVLKRIPVKKQRPGKGGFDHSNMQYLALGLRACHDAGIIFPKGLIVAFQQQLRKNQQSAQNPASPLFLDSAELERASGRSTRSTRSVNVPPQGWAYTGSGGSHGGYKGSMTAGSVGALCICAYILGQDWKKDRDVLEGMQWINKNFTVKENPKQGATWHYYYLYGLERAGMLYGTRMIGDHDWYRVGAKYLIKNQGSNGAWPKRGHNVESSVINTCFAILFLKKATRALVATGGGRH